MIWQPTLTGELVRLRPLRQDDFEPLFDAASDPLIWEQHPDPQRYTRERFALYFQSGIDSGGALVIHDAKTGAIIGSSRFCDHDAARSQVEIGYTFLTRPYWGGDCNRELKSLMLTHAFRHVKRCLFVVGKDNHRSRAAMRKIGGIEVSVADAATRDVDPATHVIYVIDKLDT